MCKYCEELTYNNKSDQKGKPYRELLKTQSYSDDIDEREIIASIIEIDEHKNMINVYFSDDRLKVVNVFIPIKYCPICGREL